MRPTLLMFVVAVALGCSSIQKSNPDPTTEAQKIEREIGQLPPTIKVPKVESICIDYGNKYDKKTSVSVRTPYLVVADCDRPVKDVSIYIWKAGEDPSNNACIKVDDSLGAICSEILDEKIVKKFGEEVMILLIVSSQGNAAPRRQLFFCNLMTGRVLNIKGDRSSTDEEIRQFKAEFEVGNG